MNLRMFKKETTKPHSKKSYVYFIGYRVSYGKYRQLINHVRESLPLRPVPQGTMIYAIFVDQLRVLFFCIQEYLW